MLANDQVTMLGERLRTARLQKGYTQAQLGEQTGFSVSYLSQVERGITVPAIGSLKKICDALGVRTYSLMFEIEEGNSGTSPAEKSGVVGSSPAEVIRSDRRKAMLFPGCNVRYELLVPNLRGKSEVVTFRAPAGATSGDEPFVHVGEETGIVLRGVLEVRVGENVHTLYEGDAIHFDSSTPHQWRNPATSEVEAIWVMTPPSF